MKLKTNYDFKLGNADGDFAPLTEIEEEKFTWRIHYGEGYNSDKMTFRTALRIAKQFNAPFVWKDAGFWRGFKYPNFEYKELTK